MDNISLIHGNNSIEIAIQKKLLENALQINNSMLSSFFALSLKDLDMAIEIRSNNQPLLQSCNEVSNICAKTLASMGSAESSLQIKPLNEKFFVSSIKLVRLFEHIMDMSNKVCLQIRTVTQEAMTTYIPALEKLANTLSLMLKCLVDAYIQQDQELAKSIPLLYTKYNATLPQINWNKETENAIQDTINLLCNYLV